MTVIVTARLGNRRRSDPRPDFRLEHQNVIAHMKEHGCLHHHVLELDEELWLMQEWESADLFERFFDRSPGFRQALREAGFREFPDDVRLWRPIESESEPPGIVTRGRSPNNALTGAVRRLLSAHPPSRDASLATPRFPGRETRVGKER